jgi:hypothetical protein
MSRKRRKPILKSIVEPPRLIKAGTKIRSHKVKLVSWPSDRGVGPQGWGHYKPFDRDFYCKGGKSARPISGGLPSLGKRRP